MNKNNIDDAILYILFWLVVIVILNATLDKPLGDFIDWLLLS